MRKMIMIASIASALVAAAAPGLASAQNACERDKHQDKVAGTVFGAIGGTLLGNLVAGHGHKGDGALVGAAGGAIVGNQLARSNTPCPDGYSRYEERRTYAPPPPVARQSAEYGRDGYRDGEHDDYRGGERRRELVRESYFRQDGYDGYDRRYERQGYVDGYGRSCRMVVRSYTAPDGDYVTRRERICQ